VVVFPVPPLPAMAIKKLTGDLLGSRESIHKFIPKNDRRQLAAIRQLKSSFPKQAARETAGLIWLIG